MAEKPDLIRSLLDASESPVLLLGAKGVIVSFNCAFERFLAGQDLATKLPRPLLDAVRRGRAHARTWPGTDGSGIRSWTTSVYAAPTAGERLVIVRGEAGAAGPSDDDPVVDAKEPNADSPLFRAIFDHSHLLVAYLDRELRFVRVNHTYAAADERTPDFFVGKKHFDLYPHVQNERVFRSVLESGEPHFERAKPFSYPDNPERGISYWDWTLVPLRAGIDSGEVGGLILTLMDVTERVRSIEHLRRAAERREALLREVHHRVKNNLQVVSSLLGLQRARVEDPVAAQALEDSRRRVHAMGLIHDRLHLSDDLGRVSFGEYCEELVEELCGAFARRGRPQLSITVDRAIRVSPEQAVPAVLVLNELVTNALRHAFPGERSGTLRVGCIRLQDGRVELSVEDDGVGFPAPPDIEGAVTLGLRLVKNLTRQLGGELDVRPSGPTRVTVRFPSFGGC